MLCNNLIVASFHVKTRSFIHYKKIIIMGMFSFPRPRKATATYQKMRTQVAAAWMSKVKIGFYGFKASEMCFGSVTINILILISLNKPSSDKLFFSLKQP
jgi:hypothetical protein